MTTPHNERLAELECEPWIRLCDSLAAELDAARERETQLIANLSDMSDDILTLQTKLLAMEETLKALQRDDGHYLECPAPNLDTHATMPRSKNVQRCILLRAALGSPQEPQA